MNKTTAKTPDALLEERSHERLLRRIDAAIYTTAVNRFEVEFEWPECHAKRCQHQHGDPRRAMGIIQHQIAESIRAELRFWSTTRPDVADTSDSAEDGAVYTLAALLSRYNVHDAGTFVKAARLMVEAYPALITALAAQEVGGDK